MKQVWKEIGKIGIVQGRNTSIPMKVILPDGEVGKDQNDILNVWKSGFNTLLNPLNSDTSTLDINNYTSHGNTPSNFDSEISNCELEAAIRETKSNKTLGHDEIPAEILRSTHLRPALLKLFNFCYNKSNTEISDR